MRMKANEDILEISQQDLEFNWIETTMLFHLLSSNASDEEFSEAICSKFNGWVLGLKLFKLASNGIIGNSVDTSFFKAQEPKYLTIFLKNCIQGFRLKFKNSYYTLQYWRI